MNLVIFVFVRFPCPKLQQINVYAKHVDGNKASTMQDHCLKHFKDKIGQRHSISTVLNEYHQKDDNVSEGEDGRDS